SWVPGSLAFARPRDDAALCLDDDARRGPVRGSRLAELAPNVLRDLAVDRGMRTVRLAHHDRAAGIRGLADFHIERHLAEERHLQPFRLAPRSAMAEHVGASAAVRADEIAHVLDDAEH